MAKRDPGRLGLIIFVGVSLPILAVVAWFIISDANSASKAEAEAAAHPPALPEGRYMPVSAGLTETRFLALDALRPAPGGGFDAVVVVIAKAAGSLEGGSAMMSKQERIDCTTQRMFEGQAGYFDPKGQLKSATTFYAGKHGRPFERGDAETAAVCDAALRKDRTVSGFRAALRETQSLPEGFAKSVEATPKDFDGWAWLCAAAARGTWRPESPQDCQRALALRPDDAALRVDRGFLNLTIGKRAAADTDFAKVMAQDPTNAGALFGHSLVLAMAGDKTASRAARIRALDLSPGVPDWIEKTYRFYITEEFRGR